MKIKVGDTQKSQDYSFSTFIIIKIQYKDPSYSFVEMFYDESAIRALKIKKFQNVVFYGGYVTNQFGHPYQKRITINVE